MSKLVINGWIFDFENMFAYKANRIGVLMGGNKIDYFDGYMLIQGRRDKSSWTVAFRDHNDEIVRAYFDHVVEKELLR